MRERASSNIHILRALLAAIDNAQAVPVGDRHAKYVPHTFGDTAVEVPRLALDADAVQMLLRQERDERVASAEQMRALGQDDRAEALDSEAAIIGRYIS